jgi:hypothetical protein
MEELQDAIEDAQYVNAIATQEEGPRPVLAWEIPTEEQLTDWAAKVRRSADPSGPDPFDVDWCLQSAIGLYLFSAFLKETCHDYLRINFVEEVARWRLLRGKHRLDRAGKIAEVYLKELPLDDVTGQRVYPERTEINEYDLRREPPTGVKLTDAELGVVSAMGSEEARAKNCLGMAGPVVDETFQTIRAAERIIQAQKQGIATADPAPVSEELRESSGDAKETANNILRQQREKYSSLKQLTQSLRDRDSDIPDKLFQKVDMIVVRSLRQQYWQQFLESEYYTKLRNFLWFQDRQVVPDDFFTMRVLGRGGFGSVIGKGWMACIISVVIRCKG